MPAHKVKLEIDQGATFDKTFTWLTGTRDNATPVDLTGCKARAHFRSELESEVVLLGLSTENGRILLGGPSGEIRILIHAVDTAAFNWSTNRDLRRFPHGNRIYQEIHQEQQWRPDRRSRAGFVLSAVASGATATVYFEGTNTAVTGLTPGPQYLGATAGKCTNAAPSGAGKVVQRVGFATSATTLNFNAGEPIVLA